MKILAIDSAALPASVALLNDDKILSENYLNVGLTHSQTLLPIIEQLINNTNTNINELDLLAVTTGPGSFTGVRIGVSTLKGLAFNKQIPLVAVSTIEAIAYNYQGLDDTIVCPVMDARCKQVYNGIFKVQNGEVIRLCEDRLLKIEELVQDETLKNTKVVLLGDGANICYDEFVKANINVKIAPEHLRYQRATAVAQIAKREYQKGNTLTDSELVPSYLRLSQAEREREEKSKAK